MTNVLFSARDDTWHIYEAHLLRAFDTLGIRATLRTDIPAPEVDYIIYAPSGGLADFTPFTRARAVLSLWAGVEKIAAIPSLTMPLARMVDPGLTQGMREWVAGHVLRHHLGMDHQILHQTGAWEPRVPPLAHNRRVGVMGLGALGRACADTLCDLGFDVAGWSRSEKSAPFPTYHGNDGLEEMLSRSDILVLLLPQTPDTIDILNAERLAQLPQGAVIINPGRGPLIDDTALLKALDRGHIGHATLDVFRTEPLPANHAFWAHPKITVTPHIASETRPETAAMTIARNIRRDLDGETMTHLVDRRAGY